MNFIKRILLLTLFITVSINALQAKEKKETTIYGFAVGTCLSDSTVYISAISRLDSAVVNNKTGFLQDRQLYSYQFKAYLDYLYKLNHTCAVFFSSKKESLEKKYIKMRRRYGKDKNIKFTEVPINQFKFINVNTNN